MVKYMKQSYKQKFYDTYIKIIPKMIVLESLRKQLLAEANIYLYVYLFCLIVQFFVLDILKNNIIFYNIIIFCIIILGLYWPNLNKKGYEFRREIKNKFYDDFLKCFDFITEHKINGSDEYIDNTMPANTLYDDMFYGCYKGIQFKILEVRNFILEQRYNIRRNLSVTFVMELNKFVKSPITIISKYNNPFIKCYYQLFSERKTNLENIVFNKNFEVVTQDQIEARYVLTNEFMNKLNQFESIFGTKSLKCIINQQRITFTFFTQKDLFEIGNLFYSVESSVQIKKFYKEITAICEMIDYFKHSEKTR